MTEEIYISLKIDDVQDWEQHNTPIDIMLSIVIIDKDNMHEEKYPCGTLEEMAKYIQVT